MPCRACGMAVEPVVDLGMQPIGRGFPRATDPPDKRLPLRVGTCASCGLTQLADVSPPEFDDPDSPSPLTSATMAAHARGFTSDLVGRGIALPSTRILSLASHGGHLAPLFEDRGLKATILEPPGPRADRLAADGKRVLRGRLDAPSPELEAAAGAYDLVVDSYLLAHLEHPRVALVRLSALLAPSGTLVLEFDDLLAKVEGGQWDAIGHGHPVYLSLGWLKRELEAIGLTVLEAAAQPVYGGAVRVFARADGRPEPSVGARLALEEAALIGSTAGLAPLAGAVAGARREVVPYLEAARAADRRIVGYGAPGRAITFLNALDIGPELLPFVVDQAAAKQGRAIAGVRIPILAPEALTADPPDEVLILTWNLVAEVRSALGPLVDRGTRLLVAIPELADVTVDGDPPRGPDTRGPAATGAGTSVR